MTEQTATDIKLRDAKIEDVLEILRNDMKTIHSAGYYNGYADAEKVSLALVTENAQLKAKLEEAEKVIYHYQNTNNWTTENYAAYNQLEMDGECVYVGDGNGFDRAKQYLKEAKQ